MVAEILKYARENRWSFSRTICYLAFMGMTKLNELKLMDKIIEFDVDKPKRQSRRYKEF
jgi:hypothetical protein